MDEPRLFVLCGWWTLTMAPFAGKHRQAEQSRPAHGSVSSPWRQSHRQWRQHVTSITSLSISRVTHHRGSGEHIVASSWHHWKDDIVPDFADSAIRSPRRRLVDTRLHLNATSCTTSWGFMNTMVNALQGNELAVKTASQFSAWMEYVRRVGFNTTSPARLPADLIVRW